ncbi:hypothetical protein JX266_004139 [Neoarthrinium moseri]|nr:hypothetical protein JX266_004139 [Neoarthrinium moseri]
MPRFPPRSSILSILCMCARTHQSSHSGFEPPTAFHIHETRLQMPLFAFTLVLCWFIAPTWAQNCSVPPLTLTIQNTTFSDGIVVNRGIQTLLGGQLLGLRLSLSQNNTRVRNARDCPERAANFSRCQGASGGVFSISEDTFTSVPPSRWNVSVVDPHPQDVTILYGYGAAEFPGTEAMVDALPVEVWSDTDAQNKSELALGPSSSFISRLVEHSWAPTRNIGLYYGSRSQNQAKDGRLIIGGFDEARFDASTEAEFPLFGYGAAISCPLQVMLADVILTNSEGNHSLFRDPDSRVPACIDTIQNAFTFTKTMYDQWAGLTRHIDFDGSNYTGQTYPADREPLLGTLTIKLSNGYTSVIPHFELVSNERGTDDQGKYAVLNSSRVMAAIQSGQGDLGNDVPQLGGVFLSQNYLRIDYDQKKFWLAKAVTNTSLPAEITGVCTSQPTMPVTNEGIPGGNKDLGLKVGLPVAFIIVIAGLFGLWRFKHRSRLPSPSPGGMFTQLHRNINLRGRPPQAADPGAREMIQTHQTATQPSESAAAQNTAKADSGRESDGYEDATRRNSLP